MDLTQVVIFLLLVTTAVISMSAAWAFRLALRAGDHAQAQARLLNDRLTEYTLAEARRANAEAERQTRHNQWEAALTVWAARMKDLDLAILIQKEQAEADNLDIGVPADGLYAAQGEDEYQAGVTHDQSWRR